MNDALAELRRLKAIGDEANLIRAKAVEVAEKDCQAKLFVTLTNGEQMAIADREAFLRTEIEGFGWHNKATLFAEPKSQQLNDGTIGFREGKPTVAEIDPIKGEKKSIWDAVRDRIREGLFVALAKLKLGAGKNAAGLFSLSISVNKNAAVAAFKAKQIKPAQLAKLGYRYCPPTDAFFIDLPDADTNSHSEAVPPTTAR